MTHSNGTDAHLVYSIEAVSNERTTPAIAVPLISESMSDSGSQPIWRPGIIKGRRTHTGFHRTKSDVGGQITVPVTPESIGGLLKALMGTAAAPTGTGPYVHALTPGNLPTFSAQIGWDDNEGTAFRKDYIGAIMGGGTLNVQANQDPTFQFDVKALSEEDDAYAEVTPSYATLTYFEFSDFTVAFDAGDDECFDTASIQWVNELYQSPAICPTNPRAQVWEDAGQQTLRGTLGQDFTSWSKYAKFTGGTAATLQVTGTAGASAIIDIELAIAFTGESAQVQGPGRIKQGVPFEIASSTSDAAAITVTLTSADATI